MKGVRIFVAGKRRFLSARYIRAALGDTDTAKTYDQFYTQDPVAAACWQCLVGHLPHLDF